jgi:hypothetical protein
MNPAMLIAFLLASGACAQTQFRAADGTVLTVVVCPMQTPAPPAEEPEEGEWK